jgi:hypothetical protein
MSIEEPEVPGSSPDIESVDFNEYLISQQWSERGVELPPAWMIVTTKEDAI